jgi:Flp pilus assembly pilin Flp
MLRCGPDNGQSLAELGLILGLIATVVIVALFLGSGQVSSILHTVSEPV